jgi:Protein of unknown function (DUF2852)
VTSISMTRMPQDRAQTPTPDTPVSSASTPVIMQILGLILFSGFAIVATVLAFVAFWAAGLVLAIILAWVGFRPLLHPREARQTADRAMPMGISAPVARSGNTSFDAYRSEVLARLEDEQERFVSFLDRLRDAKDKSEFDTFMDDRARITRDAAINGGDVGPEAARPGAY